jgi:hypothetical protein
MNATENSCHGRQLLLWLLGVPVPIHPLIFIIGGLHEMARQAVVIW